MDNIFFTAGPSQLHSKYAVFYNEGIKLNIGSINHRSKDFREIYQFTDNQLRTLLNLTPSHAIYFTGSASEIWERMILNLVEKNSFHLVNGSFSERFLEISTSLQKNAKVHRVNHGEGFDIKSISIPTNNELICTTQNETSAGVMLQPNDLVSLKKENPASILCTDIVSIAPLSKLDYNYIDSSFFSVQKAFGMPSGLGVWIVNNSCREKAELLAKKNIFMGALQQISTFQKNYEKWETPSTPNVMAIYTLGKIAEDMNNIGIENIRHEIAEKAKIVYEFANQSNVFSPLVNNSIHQSVSVIVLKCKKNSKEIIELLKAKGLVVSSGYGTYSSEEIRIANFPSTTIDDMKLLINELQKIG